MLATLHAVVCHYEHYSTVDDSFEKMIADINDSNSSEEA